MIGNYEIKLENGNVAVLTLEQHRDCLAKAIVRYVFESDENVAVDQYETIKDFLWSMSSCSYDSIADDYKDQLHDVIEEIYG